MTHDEAKAVAGLATSLNHDGKSGIEQLTLRFLEQNFPDFTWRNHREKGRVWFTVQPKRWTRDNPNPDSALGRILCG